uniref:Uncharacterized protein n=1 Tax=Octopus bimaculoides TaxID=37653 RepID=A0A0L8HLT2_OCTBM
MLRLFYIKTKVSVRIKKVSIKAVWLFKCSTLLPVTKLLRHIHILNMGQNRIIFNTATYIQFNDLSNTRTHIHVYMYVCMHVCMYACMYSERVF